ncbi:hypothetical protein Y032_0050g1971 [Ancylostoma ceylanicum]|uniref:Uncharacterized protein n=1 Tax=Ancylostoma ceylanicum TaxID=53326 RepID=A0A016U9I2_9BILA|nr:hypothetical protein Y032_0050g1971 [Ancylostoma ceylanicum]
MLLSFIAIALLCVQLSTALPTRAETTTIDQEEEVTTSMQETTKLNLGNIIDVTAAITIDLFGTSTSRAGTTDRSEEATTSFGDTTTAEE